jgi:hypothetical protein
MSTMAAAPADTLLDDRAVVDFIIRGHLLLELDLPAGVNERIAATLDGMEGNPGDAITDAVPELHLVLDHPLVQGALTSLAGEDYEVMAHRHWHCKEPGTAYMHWHQDGANRRDVRIDSFLGLYYPRRVTSDMGPTVIVPGTQFRNAPTDRMATYFNIRGQLAMVVEAGTMALVHAALWHGTAPNTSEVNRHMVKFGFRRSRENTEPTWNHDPAALEHALDWNRRGEAEDVDNILTFSNPLNVAQTDHYKERAIRRQCWDRMMGAAA